MNTKVRVTLTKALRINGQHVAAGTVRRLDPHDARYLIARKHAVHSPKADKRPDDHPDD